MKAIIAVLISLMLATSSQAINIDTVTIGNPGNALDPLTKLGAVGYPYGIGKYEVTNSEYVAFLNSVDPNGANPLALYNSRMTSEATGGIVF